MFGSYQRTPYLCSIKTKFNPKNNKTIMKTKGNNEVKANVASGISSAIGAAAGVIAGSVIVEETHASEVVVELIDDNEDSTGQTTEPVSSQDTEDTPVISSNPNQPVVSTEEEVVAVSTQGSEEVTVISSDQNQPVAPVGTEIEQQEPQIQVLAYETVVNENGSEADLAYLDVDGQIILLADENQDGRADIAISDLNVNGVLDEGELIDVTGYGIQMRPLQEAANSAESEMVAQNAEVDYVNDANIDAYYA